SHTRQSMVLREIFAALGNDPFVIAECLARPLLADRLIIELYGHDQGFYGESKRRTEAESRMHPSMGQMTKTSGRYTEMECVKSAAAEIGAVAASVSPAPDSISPIQEDQGHYYAVGAMKKGNDRFKLAKVAWLKEPLRSSLAQAQTRAPVTVSAVSSVQYRLPAIASDLPDSCTVPWTRISTTGAPAGRQYHTAVWTGSEMIVWGGYNSSALKTG